MNDELGKVINEGNTEQALPNHKHTGIDSPKVDYNDLENLPTSGTGTVAIGLATRSGSANSGTQNIAHGLSAIPGNVKLTVIWYDEDTGFKAISQSTGLYNGTTTVCIWWMIDPSTDIPNAGNSTTDVIKVYNAADLSLGQTATVTVDATNIILVFTEVGTAPGGTLHILWEAQP